MNAERERKVAGWAGVVFSALSLIVIPLAFPPPPSLGATGEEVAAYFTEHRLGFLVGNYLGILAFVAGLVQLAAVAARVRRAEPAGGFFASLVLASGTFAYAIFAASLAVFQALPFLGRPGLAVGAEAIGDLAFVWFALDGLAALPFVLAVGWAGLATGALPSWFVRASWVVALLATAMSVGSLTPSPAWLTAGGPITALGFVAFFVWTALLSVVLLRTPGVDATPTAAQA